jgi:N-methylhydantoinase A
MTFDMGGTTAKAGAIENYKPDVSYEFEAAGKTHSGKSIKGSGYTVRYPFIDLAEVSAGGGTVAKVDAGGRLSVGPESAESEPGPAAYGAGGDNPTITDANIALGKLNPSYLLGGRKRLFFDAAMKAIEEKVARPLSLDVYQAAEGIAKLANNAMAKAMAIVSVERGRDPRGFTLFAFGGGGPVHACDIANDLHISTILVPVHPGLFSAYGLLTVDLTREFSLPVMSTDINPERWLAKLRRKAGSEATGSKSFSTSDTRGSLTN